MSEERPGRRSALKMALLIALGFAVALLVVGGAMYAIAHRKRPAYFTIGEVRANLLAMWTSERLYHVEKQRYSDRVHEIGFNPQRSNRYAYFASGTGPLEERGVEPMRTSAEDTGIGVDRAFDPRYLPVSHADLPADFLGEKLGVTGTCPDCSVTLAAAGDIDGDPILDVWSISSKPRVAPHGIEVPAGAAYNHVDDRLR